MCLLLDTDESKVGHIHINGEGLKTDIFAFKTFGRVIHPL